MSPYTPHDGHTSQVDHESQWLNFNLVSRRDVSNNRYKSTNSRLLLMHPSTIKLSPCCIPLSPFLQFPETFPLLRFDSIFSLRPSFFYHLFILTLTFPGHPECRFPNTRVGLSHYSLLPSTFVPSTTSLHSTNLSFWNFHYVNDHYRSCMYLSWFTGRPHPTFLYTNIYSTNSSGQEPT